MSVPPHRSPNTTQTQFNQYPSATTAYNAAPAFSSIRKTSSMYNPVSTTTMSPHSMMPFVRTAYPYAFSDASHAYARTPTTASNPYRELVSRGLPRTMSEFNLKPGSAHTASEIPLPLYGGAKTNAAFGGERPSSSRQPFYPGY